MLSAGGCRSQDKDDRGKLRGIGSHHSLPLVRRILLAQFAENFLSFPDVATPRRCGRQITLGSSSSPPPQRSVFRGGWGPALDQL